MLSDQSIEEIRSSEIEAIVAESTNIPVSYTHLDVYKRQLDTKAFGLKKTSRIKDFAFRFISVPAKWIMTARQYVLNIYTENRAYAKPFKTEFG